MFPGAKSVVYTGSLRPVFSVMSAIFASILYRIRSFSLSIGQMTFGSFLTLLAVITATSMASVIAIRHIDSTFAELQRLQDVGDLAEEIDRRMNELRLAPRDFVDDPALRSAIDAYADAIVAVAGTEDEIGQLDKEVLGTEGRLIGRVTELLRELSARRGRVLSHDFARTLAEAKWQSIILGTVGVLIGIFAATLVVRHTVRPLAKIATSIRALAAGYKDASIPDTDVNNEIGDIARAAEVFRRTLMDADAAREAAVHALAEQRLAEESYRKLFETSIGGIYVTTPSCVLLNA